MSDDPRVEADSKGSPMSPARDRPYAAFARAVPFSLGVAFLAGCAPVTYIAPAQQPQYVEGPPQQPAYYPETPPAPAPQYEPPPAAPVAANPLDALMAPVALYPDPLISILLPASTFPSDISAAGQYLAAGGDPGQVDGQPWDPSVRSLAHYPDVVTWMASNGPWVQAVGSAFVSEPAQVMEAIQRLRELAWAAGTLATTPQQQVVVESSYVEIVPAQPNIIYVPIYDPQIVFVDQPYYDYPGPYCSYGPPYQAGVWLTFGCDWQGGSVGIVESDYWYGGGGNWRRNGPEPVNTWRFPANRPRPQAPSGWRQNPQTVRVRPIAGAPPQPPQAAFRDIHTRGPAAVTAVSRNPAAFKGKPINTTVLPRTAGAAPKAPAPSNSSQGYRVSGEPTPAPERRAPATQGEPDQVRPYAPTPTPRLPSPTPRPKPSVTEPYGESRSVVPTGQPRVEREPTPTPKARTEEANPEKRPVAPNEQPRDDRESTPTPKARTQEPNRESDKRPEPEQKATPKPAPKPSPRPTQAPNPGQ
jgi:hypothetical protein